MSAGLLDEVLAYCEKHPAWPLPEFGELRLQRHDDGTITVMGEPPEYIAITAQLLDAAEPRYLSYEGDTLTIGVAPESLRYRPLGPDHRGWAVVFQRIYDGG